MRVLLYLISFWGKDEVAVAIVSRLSEILCFDIHQVLSKRLDFLMSLRDRSRCFIKSAYRNSYVLERHRDAGD
jgi:hypothetical protein